MLQAQLGGVKAGAGGGRAVLMVWMPFVFLQHDWWPCPCPNTGVAPLWVPKTPGTSNPGLTLSNATFPMGRRVEASSKHLQVKAIPFNWTFQVMGGACL